MHVNTGALGGGWWWRLLLITPYTNEMAWVVAVVG